MFDDHEDAFIDSVLYADQTNPDFPTYGANGFGRSEYGVIAILDGNETLAYEGTDSTKAEREALNAYHRSHGKAEVLVMLDGSNWKWVFGLPKARFPKFEPVLTQSGMCISQWCGEVNPLDCYCRYNMTAEEVTRWAKCD